MLCPPKLPWWRFVPFQSCQIIQIWQNQYGKGFESRCVLQSYFKLWFLKSELKVYAWSTVGVAPDDENMNQMTLDPPLTSAAGFLCELLSQWLLSVLIFIVCEAAFTLLSNKKTSE